jgi:hypothetical protein
MARAMAPAVWTAYPYLRLRRSFATISRAASRNRTFRIAFAVGRRGRAVPAPADLSRDALRLHPLAKNDPPCFLNLARGSPETFRDAPGLTNGAADAFRAIASAYPPIPGVPRTSTQARKQELVSGSVTR